MDMRALIDLVEAETLAERRMGSLYHGTSLFSADNILKRNEIEARTQHSEEHMRIGTSVLEGVSLSRSKVSAHRFGRVVLELDHGMIAATHRIIPFAYWHREVAINPTVARAKGFSEAEEFVVGPIDDLNKYLIAVYLQGSDWTKMLQDAEHGNKVPYPSLYRCPQLVVVNLGADRETFRPNSAP